MDSHKKARNAALAIVLSVGMVLSVFLTAFQVRASGAEPDFGRFVTSYTLTVKDSHNESHTYYFDHDSGIDGDLPQVAVQDGTTVTLDMGLAVPSTAKVAGKTYTMSLPKVLQAQKASGELKGQSDNGGIFKFADWTVDDAGDGAALLTVKFTDDADDKPKGREGGFECTSTFSAGGAESDSHIEIPFEIAGATYRVPVDIYFNPVDPTLAKRGQLSTDRKTVTWTVTVTSGHDEFDSGLTDVTVTDVFDTNQVFDSDPSASPTWGEQGKNSVAVGKDDGSGAGQRTPWYEVQGADTVVFHLGDMAHDRTNILTLTTKVADTDIKPQFPNANIVYHNKATLGADSRVDSNDPKYTKEATVTDNTKTATWIGKSADTDNLRYDTQDKRMVVSIPWKIVVNKDGKGVVDSGATVTDTLNAPLTLNDDPAIGGGVYVTDAGTSTKIKLTETPGENRPYYSYIGGTITVTFPQAIATEQDITFLTDVDKNWYDANQDPISNEAILDSPDNRNQGGSPASDGSGVGPNGLDSKVIIKDGAGYNPATRIATWTVAVDRDGIAMTNPIVKDSFDKDVNGTPYAGSQVFDGISAKKVDSAGEVLGKVDLTQKGNPDDVNGALGDPNVGTYYVDAQNGTVTVHLPDFDVNDPEVVLTLTAKVTAPACFGSNARSTVYNFASLTTAGGASGTDDGTNSFTSTVLTKSGFYDYGARTLAWTLTVNKNAMEMHNAVVTDTLPVGPDGTVNGLTLAGVTLRKAGAETGDTSVPRKDGDTGSDLHYTLDGRKLTIYLGNAADGTTRTVAVTEDISYDFLADGNNNQDLTVKNSATLRYTELGSTSEPATGDVSVTIHQSVVEKNGSYNGTTNQLDWKVLVNKNQIPADFIGITDETAVSVGDTLPEGLTLDPSSVHLYSLSGRSSQDGTSWSTRTEIPLTPLADSVTYDLGTRRFTFRFPSGTDFSQALELDFSTDIGSQQSDTTYVNTVDMTGVKGVHTGETDHVRVSQSNYQSWFIGHADELGSATVTKLDQDTRKPIPGTEFTLSRNGFAVQTAKTGSDGTVTFSNLKLGTEYTIEETKPADGYQPNSTEWTFTLDDSTPSQQYQQQTFQDLKTGASSSEASSQPESSSPAGSSQPESSAVSSSVSSQSGAAGGHDNGGGGGGTTTSNGSSSAGSAVSGASSSAPGTPGTSQSASSAVSGAPHASGVVPAAAALYVKKADSQGRGLSGAEFTLFGADGKALQKRVTGSTGVIVFQGLAAGGYSVRETKAPPRYRLYSGALSVTLAAGQREGYTLRDSLESDSPSAVLGWTSDGSLPKTGQVPVAPFAIACGLLLILGGVAARRSASRRESRGMRYIRK